MYRSILNYYSKWFYDIEPRRGVKEVDARGWWTRLWSGACSVFGGRGAGEVQRGCCVLTAAFWQLVWACVGFHACGGACVCVHACATGAKSTWRWRSRAVRPLTRKMLFDWCQGGRLRRQPMLVESSWFTTTAEGSCEDLFSH